MNTKIIKNKSLKDYQKKYRHNTSLIKISKKDVESFDKNHPDLCKNYLLDGKNWWLIDNIYYQIPKPVGRYWFRNLHIGAQISLCALLGVAVTAGVATPTYYYGFYDKAIIVDKDSSSNIDIVSVTTNQYGDKLIETKGKAGSTPTISLEVYKGNDKLIYDEEYIYTKNNSESDSYLITVYKPALNKHFGPIRVKSINQKQIVVTPGIVNLSLGQTITLHPTVDGQPIDVNWTQVGTHCLDRIGDNDFKASVIGNCNLRASMRGYATAIVPVTVTTDKIIIITPESIEDKKIGQEVEISAKLDTGEAASFTFIPLGSSVEITESTATTAKIKAVKSGLGAVRVETGPYYKYFTFVIDPIAITGERNIAIPDTETEDYQFKSDAATEGSALTWELDSSTITDAEATIDSQSGVLTVKPGISKTISTYVIAKKEQEVQKYNVIIASFDKLKFEIHNDYCLAQSSDDGTSKTASGNVYLPTSYYDKQTEDFYPLIGLKPQAFEGTSITNIAFTYNIQVLEDECLKNCTGLTKLTFPNSLANIGKNIIQGCSSLATYGVEFTDSTPWAINTDNGLKGFTPDDTQPVDVNKDALDTYSDYKWIKSNLAISGDTQIAVGGEVELSTTQDDIVWTTEDHSVATVDENGKLKGVAAGSTYVFAQNDKRLGVKKVVVTA